MKVRVFLKVSPVAILLAAPMPSIPSQAEVAPCAAPTIKVASQTGGKLQFNIQSPCRKGQLVLGRYGDAWGFLERFDGNGYLAFLLDCFLGDREIDLTFMNEWHFTDHSCSAIDNALTKVAIVWHDHVDLDLHAFEYAVPPGSDYDRSASNPGSYQTARLEYSRSGRSYGFMSTVSDGRQLGYNVEVYTLLRHPAEPRGLITMAVSLGSHNSEPDRESCSNGSRNQLRVDLDVYVLEHRTKLRHYERVFVAQPCNDASTRFVTNLVPNIVLGNAPAGGAANAE
jgi:hypothetical protein